MINSILTGISFGLTAAVLDIATFSAGFATGFATGAAWKGLQKHPKFKYFGSLVH